MVARTPKYLEKRDASKVEDDKIQVRSGAVVYGRGYYSVSEVEIVRNTHAVGEKKWRIDERATTTIVKGLNGRFALREVYDMRDIFRLRKNSRNLHRPFAPGCPDTSRLN